jgi:predicted RNase H-like HicB family nuclease
VRVHEEDDGSFWAEVLDLPGCFASGFDWDELKEALTESVSLYLSTPEHTVNVKLVGFEPPSQVEPVEDDKVLLDA